jgi:hypothetical protein
MQDNSPDLLGARKKLQRSSPIVPILIVLACAVVLTGGSLYGVAATCSYGSRSEWTDVFFASALVGLALVVLCLSLMVVWAVWKLAKRFRGNS